MYNNICEQSESLESMETDSDVTTAAFRTARQQLVSICIQFFQIKYY